jgi:hypothetical protein
MTIRSAPFNLLTFPQHWDAATRDLTVRFVCLPSLDPDAKPMADHPSFDQADLRLCARFIDSLDRLPRGADALPSGAALVPAQAPFQKAALFSQLAEHIQIAPRIAPAAGPRPRRRFLKPATESYRSVVGRKVMSPYLIDEARYKCALHEAHADQAAKPQTLAPTLRWAQVIAFVLRQPALATQLGLIGQFQVKVPNGVFERGGWLYLEPHGDGDYAGEPALVSLQAARIPPLVESRDLYAAVLFPLDQDFNADHLFADAERYDRGFARHVHAVVGHEQRDCIRLGWDDEQVAEWLNRQADPVGVAPMGTGGYRVDVREAGNGGDWHSLQRIESLGALALGPLDLGTHTGESRIEIMPSRLSKAQPDDYWMPPYFTTWRGASLVLSDANLVRLHRELDDVHADYATLLMDRERCFRAAGLDQVTLRYGKQYQFRVRLADLSHGGPPPEREIPVDAGDDHGLTTTVAFMRTRRPGPVAIMRRPTQEQRYIAVAKPRLGYPELLFAGNNDFDQLIEDARGGHEREPGLPDPDVVALAIEVHVRALVGDRVEWQRLYLTHRPFTADLLELELDLQDCATLDSFTSAPATAGPLPIPTARDIRFTFRAIGHDEPGYFADTDAREGEPVHVDVRAAARSESSLFGPVDLPLRSFYLRASANERLPNPIARLGQELDLEQHGPALSGRAGARVVFGCAASMRHTLSPERGSLAFAAETEIVESWINVVQLRLCRDWSWSGLAESGIAVDRSIRRIGLDTDFGDWHTVGEMHLPAAISPRALGAIASDADPARDPLRQSTQLLFFDSIDARPARGTFPCELEVKYRVRPTFASVVAAPPDEAPLTTRLPVSAPPTQVPRLVSAGIALTPYEAAGDYSATRQRQRRVWLEFDRSPLDPGDAYFVRVLAVAPDPAMLRLGPQVAEVRETALPLDSEWMRLIVPGQPRDYSGRHAMSQLAPSGASGAQHCLVPLPDGIGEDAPELFGMFTYEIRVGHANDRWCTAQGRFGPPLRIAGVQHAPPPLRCQVARLKDGIHVRAPFALPVHEGAILQPDPPATRLWGLLYARVRQADGRGWRNVLLERRELEVVRPTPSHWERHAPSEARHGAVVFPGKKVESVLGLNGLPADAPLTALAVELFDTPDTSDPLGDHLAQARILRVSSLVAVPEAC